MFIQWDGDVCIEKVFEPGQLVPDDYAYTYAGRESWFVLPPDHRAVQGLRYMRRMTPEERKRYLTKFRITANDETYEVENVSMHEVIRQCLRSSFNYQKFSIEVIHAPSEN